MSLSLKARQNHTDSVLILISIDRYIDRSRYRSVSRGCSDGWQLVNWVAQTDADCRTVAGVCFKDGGGWMELLTRAPLYLPIRPPAEEEGGGGSDGGREEVAEKNT